MTAKIQYSKKYADGSILVVGGDTPEEFRKFYEEIEPWFKKLDGLYNEPPKQQHELKDNGGDMPFEVENIKLASGGDHPRWVVQGGNFTKFGITCWPEVLEKAGIMEHLDPLNDNKPKGKWMAHYVNKPDGKPDKVILLERE